MCFSWASPEAQNAGWRLFISSLWDFRGLQIKTSYREGEEKEEAAATQCTGAADQLLISTINTCWFSRRHTTPRGVGTHLVLEDLLLGVCCAWGRHIWVCHSITLFWGDVRKRKNKPPKPCGSQQRNTAKGKQPAVLS